jgi:hypothetical protein
VLVGGLPILDVVRLVSEWTGLRAALSIDALWASACEIGIVWYGEVAATGAQKPSCLSPPHHGFESSAFGAVGASDDIVHAKTTPSPERRGVRYI